MSKEAIAEESTSFKGLHFPEDEIKRVEKLIVYKLSRLAELSGMKNPVVQMEWICRATMTENETVTKVIEG